MAPAEVRSLCVALWVTGFILSSHLAVSFGDQAMDCCLMSSNHLIPKQIVVGYREQLKGEGCAIDAIIFQTRRGRNLCAPPASKWAIDLKTWLDQQWKKCKELKSKGKRCQGIKPKSA